MNPSHPRVLDLRRTALLVIDVQERFRAAMEGFDSMAAGCVRLIRAARLLGLPVLVTEQYPKGLGPTVGEVLEALGTPAGPAGAPSPGPAEAPPAKVAEKTAFSSCGAAGLLEELKTSGARTVLVCGIETHVCVNQTVHDLLAGGYEVQVAVDAVQSRHAVDREAALRKMERSGAVLTTSEMAVFELLRDAKHPRFKQVQALFKGTN